MSFRNFKPAPVDMSCEPCQLDMSCETWQETCQITTLDIPSSQGILTPPSVDYNDGSNPKTHDRSSEIREMLSGIAKHTNANYQRAVQKAKADPLVFRKDRALRRIRPTMSADRYTDTLKAVSKMDSAQLLDWIISAEQHIEATQHGH